MSAAVIVNAAGAWADEVAAACGVAPLGIQPYRRTVLQLRLGVAVPAELPLVIHVGCEFYFKGEIVGRLWLRPHDETPTGAHGDDPGGMDGPLEIEGTQVVGQGPEERQAYVGHHATKEHPV